MASDNGSPFDSAALAIFAILGDRPVAFHPELARALGDDIPAALILGQLMYWTGKGTWRPEWIAKTQGEFYSETALKRSAQERARKKLVSLGVIKEERRGVPARLWFQVQYDKLAELLQIHLTASDLQCGEPAIKSAGNLQSEGGEGADKSAGNQQSISESTPETTSSESTPERSGAKAPHRPVLDDVFPESAAVERSASAVLEGSLDDLSADEREQIASPVQAEKPKRRRDKREEAWQEHCRRVVFPHGMTWHQIYEYALTFSELMGIPVPRDRRGISQWRSGIVKGVMPFADAMEDAGWPMIYPTVLLRRAKWGLQVLHARRERGDAYDFDIASPMSTANTLRVIAGDLSAMEKECQPSNGQLPGEDQILAYYNGRPGGTQKRTGGSDTTANAIAQLEMLEVA